MRHWRASRVLLAFSRESSTYDRRSEMARNVALANRLNIGIRFAFPHLPWQRRVNGNRNGLLRQYLPKGVDLSHVSQRVLNDLGHRPRGRARRTLEWKTPEQPLGEEITHLQQRTALEFLRRPRFKDLITRKFYYKAIARQEVLRRNRSFQVLCIFPHQPLSHRLLKL